MISRDIIASHVQAMVNEHAKKVAASQQGATDAALVAGVTWGANETSMISHAQLHVANNMIERLKAKYKVEFERLGGQQLIEAKIKPFLEKLILQARNEKDKVKEEQYSAALRVITSPDSDFHASKNTAIYNQNLRALLALVWIAANDEKAVLRPQHERALQEIADPERRQAERVKLVHESLINSMVFGLNEIRTAHNDDPVDEDLRRMMRMPVLQRGEDRPSCTQGAYGRLVLSCCPLSCVTMLTNETLTYTELEEKVLAMAKNKNEIALHDVPNEVENFFINCLMKEKPEVREAIFQFYTMYMNGLEEPDKNATPEEMLAYEKEKNLYDKSKSTYDAFLTKMQGSIIELYMHLEASIKGLSCHSRVNQRCINEIADLFIAGMRPENTAAKDFITEVYASEQDKNLIERMRKIGAVVAQQKGFQSVISQSNAINDIRVKVRMLYTQLTILQNICTNEIARGLLAVNSMQFPRDMEKWSQLKAEIDGKLEFYNQTINQQILPNLEIYRQDLNRLLPTAIAGSTTAVTRNVGFDLLLTPVQLKEIQGNASKTAEASAKSIGKLNIAIDQFVALLPGVNNAILIEALGMQKSKSWNQPADWAREFVRIAHSSLHAKAEELTTLDGLMKLCCSEEVCQQVKLAIGHEFNHYRQHQPDVTWVERRNAMHTLTALFPGQDIGLQHQAIMNLTELTRKGDELMGNQQASAVLLAANCPLQFLNLDPSDDTKLLVETVDVYKARFNEWQRCAITLLPTMSEKISEMLVPDKNESYAKDLDKIKTFVALTVFQNLKLTDLRCDDIVILNRLTEMYFATQIQKVVVGGPMFELKEDDTLQTRLNYLTVHLSAMLTSLTPVSCLFNTGHVRILDRVEAEKLIGETKAEVGMCIVRTSTSTPTVLAMSDLILNRRNEENIQHTLPRTAQTVGATIIDKSYLPEGMDCKLNFKIMNDARLQSFCVKDNPALTLVSYESAIASKPKMQAVSKAAVYEKQNCYQVLDLGDFEDKQEKSFKSRADQPVAQVVAQVRPPQRRPAAIRTTAAALGMFPQSSGGNSNNDTPPSSGPSSSNSKGNK
jgi:hypothetical protein